MSRKLTKKEIDDLAYFNKKLRRGLKGTFDYNAHNEKDKK